MKPSKRKIDTILKKGWSLTEIKDDGTYCFSMETIFKKNDPRILYHYGFLSNDFWYNNVSFRFDQIDMYYQMFLLEREHNNNWISDRANNGH